MKSTLDFCYGELVAKLTSLVQQMDDAQWNIREKKSMRVSFLLCKTQMLLGGLLPTLTWAYHQKRPTMVLTLLRHAIKYDNYFPNSGTF